MQVNQDCPAPRVVNDSIRKLRQDKRKTCKSQFKIIPLRSTCSSTSIFGMPYIKQSYHQAVLKYTNSKSIAFIIRHSNTRYALALQFPHQKSLNKKLSPRKATLFLLLFHQRFWQSCNLSVVRHPYANKGELKIILLLKNFHR